MIYTNYISELPFDFTEMRKNLLGQHNVEIEQENEITLIDTNVDVLEMLNEDVEDDPILKIPITIMEKCQHPTKKRREVCLFLFFYIPYICK